MTRYYRIITVFLLLAAVAWAHRDNGHRNNNNNNHINNNVNDNDVEDNSNDNNSDNNEEDNKNSTRQCQVYVINKQFITFEASNRSTSNETDSAEQSPPRPKTVVTYCSYKVCTDKPGPLDSTATITIDNETRPLTASELSALNNRTSRTNPSEPFGGFLDGLRDMFRSAFGWGPSDRGLTDRSFADRNSTSRSPRDRFGPRNTGRRSDLDSDDEFGVGFPRFSDFFPPQPPCLCSNCTSVWA